MGKTRCRRPQIEALESIVCLSGATINMPMLPAGSHPLFPRGTIEGVYTEQGAASTAHFTASGSLTPLGETTVVGSLGTTDTVTIQTQTGDVTLQLSKTGRAGHFDYGIEQATGSYAGDQGAGTVVVKFGHAHKDTSADTRSGPIRMTFGVYHTPLF